MSLILHIETATETCSVALCKGADVIAEKESTEMNVHSSKLTVFIEEMFQDTAIDISSLDAVAVSKGPGSYTGLRIGVSAAKGICYGIGKPLIAINTLQSLANGFLQNIEKYFEADTE
ncbi:MAG: tRNA (adenosine(37)-N6)-threonylcarbamoyltransferase complex dimerization subunit type 1 TsaB, partial [Bacteroidetes bacterium RIFOXYA12_FULL_35_11]